MTRVKIRTGRRLRGYLVRFNGRELFFKNYKAFNAWRTVMRRMHSTYVINNQTIFYHQADAILDDDIHG